MTAANGSPDDKDSGAGDDADKPADAGRQDDETTPASLEDLAKAGAISADFMEILQEMRDEDSAGTSAAAEDGNSQDTPPGDTGAADKTPKD